MKKVLFSSLMLSALFVIASCGSKSNSGEATEATQEQEQVKEVTFTDPAITYDEGLDLTSYFSAESVTQPSIWEDNSGENHLSTNVKLKLLKKLNLEMDGEYGFPKIGFVVKFCDKGGSIIAQGDEYKDFHNLKNMNEGSILSLDVASYEESILENDMKEKLDKVEKIEVGIKTKDLKFVETAESTEE